MARTRHERGADSRAEPEPEPGRDRCRHLTAVTALALRSIPRSLAPSSLRAGKRRASCWRASCASSFSRALRTHTLGLLPRGGAHPLRACALCSKQVRIRCAHAHLLLRSKGTPPSPFAAHVRASSARCCGGARGNRRPLDITPDYAQASCPVGAARGIRPRETPRPRNRHYVQVAAALPCASKVPRSQRGRALAPARSASARLPALLSGAAARRLF